MPKFTDSDVERTRELCIAFGQALYSVLHGSEHSIERDCTKLADRLVAWLESAG